MPALATLCSPEHCSPEHCSPEHPGGPAGNLGTASDAALPGDVGLAGQSGPAGNVLAHGHELDPLTPAAVLTQADPLSLAGLALLVAMVLYLWAVARLRRRGLGWSPARVVLFLAGLAALALATVSGLAAYDTTLLSVHMIQHMLLSMVAPILLALGAPVTLALRALQPRPRRAVLAVVHSGYLRLVTFPVIAFAIFVASPFVLYFSGLYRASLAHEWLHQFVHLHFVVAGCLFFWPLIGLDPLPTRPPYPLRALLVFLSTPFHTVLGLTVMQSAQPLGGDWYPSLALDWADPLADQRLAGGILWAGGEIVSVALLGALLIQWMRASEREARRIDRALDRAEAEQAAREQAGAGQAGAGQAGAAPAGAEHTGAEHTGADRAGNGRAGDGRRTDGYDRPTASRWERS